MLQARASAPVPGARPMGCWAAQRGDRAVARGLRIVGITARILLCERVDAGRCGGASDTGQRGVAAAHRNADAPGRQGTVPRGRARLRLRALRPEQLLPMASRYASILAAAPGTVVTRWKRNSFSVESLPTLTRTTSKFEMPVVSIWTSCCRSSRPSGVRMKCEAVRSPSSFALAKPAGGSPIPSPDEQAPRMRQ